MSDNVQPIGEDEESRAYSALLARIPVLQERARSLFQRFKLDSVSFDIGIAVPVYLGMSVSFARKDFQ